GVRGFAPREDGARTERRAGRAHAPLHDEEGAPAALGRARRELLARRERARATSRREPAEPRLVEGAEARELAQRPGDRAHGARSGWDSPGATRSTRTTVALRLV